MAERTELPFEQALPRLLEERARRGRRLSLRAVARAAAVDPTHLSRILRGQGNKTVTSDLARRVAVALDLPEDYFREYRRAAVIARLEDQRAWDRLYDQLTPRRRARKR